MISKIEQAKEETALDAVSAHSRLKALQRFADEASEAYDLECKR